MVFSLHLLRPYWLLALIPVALLWWALWRRQDAHGAWRQLIAPHLLDHLLVAAGRRARLRPIHLLLAVWLLSLLALSGPSWQKEPSPFAEDEAGMVVVLKVTPSMMATDVQPTRLDRAKHKLRDILERREAGATALIAYSGSAHVVMPLTRDSRIIEIMAEGLVPDTMPKEGDALAEALKLSETLVEKSGTANSVLIIADTVSPGQTPALERYAKRRSLPIQSLAVTAPGAQVDSGLQQATRLLKANMTALTVDDTDVAQLTRQAQRDVRSVAAEQSGERWKDAGCWLLPPIALCALVWGRKGWVVQ